MIKHFVNEYKFIDEAVLNVNPFHHMMGFLWSILFAPLTGWTAIYLEKFDVESYLRTIEKYKVEPLSIPHCPLP